MKNAKCNLGLAIATLVLLTSQGLSQSRKVGTAIKLSDPHPGFPNQLLPQAINNRGDITGHIGDEHDGTGFLRTRDGQFQEFEFPGQCDGFFFPCTYPQGINNRGQIVGLAHLLGGAQGFMRETDGSMHTLPLSPANSGSPANGINDRGDIVGFYVSGLITNGFLLRKDTFTTIDFPGVTLTRCTGINSSGLITGSFLDPSNAFHGFLWDRGNFIATFQVFINGEPKNTFPTAINDRGQVVGTFENPVNGGGFLRNPDGTLEIVDLNTLLQPIGGLGPIGALMSINDRGDLVGWSGNVFQPIFGFLIPRAGAREIH